MCYGYNPDFTVRNTKQSHVPQADELADHLKQIHEEAKAALNIANHTYARYYDDKCREAPQIEVGSKVYLDGTNIKTQRSSKKLDHKKLGPYKVIKKIGKYTYQLELPKSMKIHPVFHVSLLFPKPDDEFKRDPIPLPPVVTPEGEEEYLVEKILDSRFKRKQLQYHVQWKGYGPEENTWEPKANLANALEKIKEFHCQHPEAAGP
ncbi:hypothetical protein OPQ81_005062 [Rhizoctonia solani]|nr:hypothetical protein OPQ81_005062 [Rhizoctonia solani]